MFQEAVKQATNPSITQAVIREPGSFFLYDLDALAQHLKRLSDLSGSAIRLWYACKANPLSSILKVVRESGFGFDVASRGELDQVLRSVGPTPILMTGPAKSESLLAHAIESGVRVFVVESKNQLHLLKKLAQVMAVRDLQILIRVQLEWETTQSGAFASVLGGNEVTPFGVDFAEWETVNFKEFSELEFLGFHVFQWGNILDLSRMEAIWQYTAEACQSFANKRGLPSRVLDLGGGLGISYAQPEASGLPSLNWSCVVEVLKEIKTKYGFQQVWLEMGRYAVGPFGVYVTPIVDRKRVRGKEILVTEGGIQHLARPALTGESFPCSLLRQSEAERIPFQVHGPLCTSLDRSGEFLLPSDVNVGDHLVFSQTGAYGFTESMPFFLCHEGPAEFVLGRGGLEKVREPLSPASWLK